MRIWFETLQQEKEFEIAEYRVLIVKYLSFPIKAVD